MRANPAAILETTSGSVVTRIETGKPLVDAYRPFVDRCWRPRVARLILRRMGLLLVALVLLSPVLATVLGFALPTPVSRRAGAVALVVEGVVVAFLLLRVGTLPGDHYYVDHSVCRKPDSEQKVQVLLALVGSLLACAGVGFTVAVGRQEAGLKIAQLALALGLAVVAVMSFAAYALCDPS